MTHRTFDEAVGTRDNCFDILRLIAAVTVLFSHSFVLTGHAEPVHSLLGSQLGSLGVYTFFGLSGFLITRSWVTDPHVLRFTRRRALRILPGLAVCAVLTALVLGPLVTALSPGEYFGSAEPWQYVLKMVALVTFNPELPGVFLDTPFPRTVNGSLWTIPVESVCYALAALTGVLGILTRRRVLIASMALVLAIMIAGAPLDSPTGENLGNVDAILNATRCGGAFLMGVILWVFRAEVPRSTPLLVIGLLLALAPLPDGLHSAFAILAFPYAAILLGAMHRGRLAVLTRHGDLSYGFYVYCFPVQQTLAHLIPGLTPAGMLALAGPIAWLLGLLSWRLVEHPALRLKPRARSAEPPEPPGPTLPERHRAGGAGGVVAPKVSAP